MLDRLLFDELLKAVVDLLPSDDLLPTALSYRRMGRACVLRAHRGAKGGPRWITAATTTLARTIWAVDAMDAMIPSSWCAALAKRGDETLLCHLLSGIRWDPPDLLDATVCAAAAAGGHP